jgi:hypothetical protein
MDATNASPAAAWWVAAALGGDPAHVIVECYPAAPNDLPDTIPTRPRE